MPQMRIKIKTKLYPPPNSSGALRTESRSAQIPLREENQRRVRKLTTDKSRRLVTTRLGWYKPALDAGLSGRRKRSRQSGGKFWRRRLEGQDVRWKLPRGRGDGAGDYVVGFGRALGEKRRLWLF